MKTLKPVVIIVNTLILGSILQFCTVPDRVNVTSPNGKFRFEFSIQEAKPCYRVYYDSKEIIGLSSLGFEISGKRIIPGNVKIEHVIRSRKDDSWKPVYGEKDLYPEHYQQAIVKLKSGDKDLPVVQLRIRACNEGLAFRYEFIHAGRTVIEKELTEFALPAGSDLWVSTSAQAPIVKRKISELPGNPVERPLLAQLDDSVFVALGEAALVDFARMKFIPDKKKSATLVARLDGEVVFDGDFQTPWRIIMAGNTAGEILENNYLLLNLNEPNKIDNCDWIKPGKVIREITLTTRGGMACVDFAAAHNLQYIEFDAGWYGNEYDKASDATTVTVDPKRSKGPLHLQQVIHYAESKGIGVILYINRRAMEKQLDEVLPLVQSWGVKGLKYGFVQVGSQKWTAWLHEAVRKAAAHKLMVDIHDEYRPTGYSRTYPNLMTQEGIRGDEESPDNAMVLNTLFVRMLAGAADQTNCYFSPRVDNKMGSHASQLAKTVCLYSPWQFLYWYDRPAASSGKTGGSGASDRHIVEVPELTFFDQLPTVWDDTKVIEGYPGAYAVVARRSGSTWFVGVLNGKHDRDFTIPLDFLDPGNTYEATLFTDNKEIQTQTGVAIEKTVVSSDEAITKRVGNNRGMAIILKKITGQ